LSVRVVSLVPSLTLTLFDFGLTSEHIVGRTPWCIHPKSEVDEVPVVGGTKTPTLSKIKAACPDLVVMDRDENPKAVYEWCLEQGFSTFVCHVRHPSDVPGMLRELGVAVGCEEAAEAFAVAIEDELAQVPVQGSRTALPLIWHDPLMAANGTTYAGNMLTCLGFKVPNIESEGTGYPVVTPDSIVENGVTDLFLSSEPHEFTTAEGQALHAALAQCTDQPPAVHFIDGEDLTWMGSRTATALQRLRTVLDVA
jgi:ABC-type Fe3+-hydroxamate transport system substrate-binding protein